MWPGAAVNEAVATGEAVAAERPLRVGLLGLFGAGNYGNDGSLEAMLRLLRRDLPDASLVAICADPDVVASRHRVATLPYRVVTSDRPFQRRLDRALLGLPTKLLGWSQPLAVTRKLDLMVVPGTGILDDFGTGPGGMPYGLLRWCAAARLNGVRIAFVSIGAGPIHNPVSRWLMSRAVALADYRSYRDTPSRDFLGSLGFDTSREPLRPDLAFSLDPRPTIDIAPQAAGPPTIGLGLMAYRGWSGDAVAGGPTFERYAERMTALLQRMLERGYRVRLLTGETTDALAVDAVLDRIAGRVSPALRQRILWQEPRSLEDVIALALTTDVVVAARFHNIVGALMAGRPAISLGYAAKNVALLEEFGLGAFCHDIETFDLDAVLAQVAELAADRDRHGVAIRAKVEAFRRQLDAQQDWLLESLAGRRREGTPGSAVRSRG